MIEELYGQYYNEMIRWATNMTGHNDVAEEIVQEGFLRAIQSSDVLQSLSSEQRRSWLYRTIKNLWIDRCRKHSRELYPSQSMSEEDDVERYALPQVEDYETSEWEQMLDALPGLEGVFMLYRYVNGYTSTEIGELFQMPAGTVRSTLSSARKHLQQMMK